jgi:dTDP-4-dehydrorhamnose reductase
MKILITGGSGALGRYLNSRLAPENNILSLYYNSAESITAPYMRKTDITDYSEVKKVFAEFRPDIVIHAAAASNPALCDSLPVKEAYNLNVDATGGIASLANEYGAKIIYISTDLVYAGYRGSMLNESAKLIPISFYAETKLLGEMKITQIANKYLILRTALLFGFSTAGSRNHFQKMYLSFKNGKEEKLFTDQFRTPLSFFDAARIIDELIKLDVSGEIINLGGPERASRAQLGELLCRIAGFDKKLILPALMEEIPGTYKVADVSLNTEKLRSYGIKQNSLYDSVKYVLENIPLNLK